MVAAMTPLIQTFDVMQLVAYLTMMNLQYPSNAQVFSKANIKFVNLDLIDPVAVTTFLRFNFS